MAFGESLGIIEDRINQVKSHTSWPTGQLDHTVFETKDPLVAESIMHIFDVSHPKSLSSPNTLVARLIVEPPSKA